MGTSKKKKEKWKKYKSWTDTFIEWVRKIMRLHNQFLKKNWKTDKKVFKKERKKEILQQGLLNWYKVTEKTCIMLQRFMFQINAVLLNFLFIKETWKNVSQFLQKY